MEGPLAVIATVVITVALVGGLYLWSGAKLHRRRLARLGAVLPRYAALGLTTATGMFDVASIRGVPKPPAVRHLPVRVPSVGVVDGARVAVYETFRTVPGRSSQLLPHAQDRLELVAAFVDSPVTVPGDITLAGWHFGRTPTTLAVTPAVPGRMAAVVGRGWTSDEQARWFVETLLTQDLRHWIDRLPRDVLTLSFSASSICGTLRWGQVLPPGSVDGPELVQILLELRRRVSPELVAAFPPQPS